MAWSTPPTFVDATTLGVADIQKIIDDLRVLEAPDTYYFSLAKPVPGASSEASGQLQEYAIDGSTATQWRSNVELPCWWKADLAGFPQAVQKYIITGHATPAHSPSDWTFEGSNDDTNWAVLDTQSSITWTTLEVKTFTFTNTTKYRYYRVYITNSSGGTSSGFAEIEFYLDSSTTLNLLGNSDHTTSSTTFVSISDEFEITLTNAQSGHILVKFYAGVINDAAFDIYINDTAYFSSASSSGNGYVEFVNTSDYVQAQMQALLVGYSGSVTIKIVWRKTGSSDPSLDTNRGVRFLAAVL